MIADEKEEAFAADEVLGAEDGVAESEWFGLFDEGDGIEVFPYGFFEVALGAGGDDDGYGIDSSGQGFVEKQGDHGLCFSRGTHECLEGEVLLVGAGGRDDGFGDFHKLTDSLPNPLS